MPLNESEIEALVKLLDEPDPADVSGLLLQLAERDDRDLRQLEERAITESRHVRRNLASAIDRARFGRLGQEWIEATRRPRVDLEQALVLISRTALPGEVSSAEIVSRKLDRMAHDVATRLAGDRAFDAGLDELAEVLSCAYGLRAAESCGPGNGYLAQTLETGRGSGITLCAVALLVGERLDLPIHGIDAPGRFLGFYGDPDVPLGTYFNPLDGFRAITMGEIVTLVGAGPGKLDHRVLLPVDTRRIVELSLRSLIASHELREDGERARNLSRWLEILLEADPV